MADPVTQEMLFHDVPQTFIELEDIYARKCSMLTFLIIKYYSNSAKNNEAVSLSQAFHLLKLLRRAIVKSVIIIPDQNKGRYLAVNSEII